MLQSSVTRRVLKTTRCMMVVGMKRKGLKKTNHKRHLNLPCNLKMRESYILTWMKLRPKSEECKRLHALD
jgi:hypothetical protein